MTEQTDSTELPANTPQERIQKALAIAVAYGGIDGAHHKDWTIDQMVRALTGCPLVTRTETPPRGPSYEYKAQGDSPEYVKLVADACNGEDGPDSYSWSTGIAP